MTLLSCWSTIHTGSQNSRQCRMPNCDPGTVISASWPETLSTGGQLAFASLWRNAGVAPCLPGGHPTITLKDSKGGIVAVLVDDSFDVRSLPVVAAGKAENRSQEKPFLLPFQPSIGDYDVFPSIGTPTGTPRVALPLDGDDGQRRCGLGTIQVVVGD
jgi:hypothetical protein